MAKSALACRAAGEVAVFCEISSCGTVASPAIATAPNGAASWRHAAALSAAAGASDAAPGGGGDISGVNGPTQCTSSAPATRASSSPVGRSCAWVTLTAMPSSTRSRMISACSAASLAARSQSPASTSTLNAPRTMVGGRVAGASLSTIWRLTRSLSPRKLSPSNNSSQGNAASVGSSCNDSPRAGLSRSMPPIDAGSSASKSRRPCVHQFNAASRRAPAPASAGSGGGAAFSNSARCVSDSSTRASRATRLKSVSDTPRPPPWRKTVRLRESTSG